MIRLTDAERSEAYRLCKGRTPVQCEVEADVCAKAGNYAMAAIWYQAAANVSIGRTRTDMYERAACNALRKAGRT